MFCDLGLQNPGLAGGVYPEPKGEVMMTLNWWRGVLRVWALLSVIWIGLGVLDNDLLSLPDGRASFETDRMVASLPDDEAAYSPDDIEAKAKKAESLGYTEDAAGLRVIRDKVQIYVDNERSEYFARLLQVAKSAPIFPLGLLAFLFLTRWVIRRFRSVL
jgi:hypothetical protein